MTHVMQLSQNQVMPEKEKKQRRLRVGQIVPIGFGALLAIVGISTTITEISKANLKETQGLVEQGFKVKELLGVVAKDLVDAETGLRGFLITDRPAYLQPFDDGRKNLPVHMDSLKKLIIDPNQRVKAEKVEQRSQERIAALEEIFNLKKAGKDKEAIALVLTNKSKNIMDDVQAKIEEMSKEQDKIVAQRQKASEQVQQVSSIIAWSGLIVGIGTGLFVSYYVASYISRLIIGPITDAAKAVASSSAGIADTVDKQERAVLDQTNSVNETTTIIEELGWV